MNDPEDIIKNLAYTELLIACQKPGCQNLFQRTIEEPSADPVDEWAKRMANFAREAGWIVDASGRVLCTMHSRLWRDTTYNDE
ncbi:MAG: hypothetical protein WA071_08625 [Undibacterium umbellatum]|uniref:hypothetical protein n=1 Tax=Undibacterium umbellatum TaxID=2762300 RepID=UPI003BB79B82